MTQKLTLEIDGHVCEAERGEMIIAVADREGIAIPRFCYHKKLSVAANCRMCLVEVEQGGRPVPKPLPACATAVADGMKVKTRSPLALEAQRGTMEFLLINHPLDCPICDQGGECELQDVAMGYGGDLSRYSEGKRVVKDEDLGPLIATDMTRCIHCTRCVRFGAEVAGLRELGATGRGEDMRIGTYVEHTIAHELSGNIIDLCPVGALTSKPFRFQARAWEMTQADGVAAHDSLGSNIHFHIRGRRVMRVHPKDNESINETWISDRDRFSYEGLTHPDRLTVPMIKRDGQWAEASWEDALARVADAFKGAGEGGVGALIAPTATLEEMYLSQRIVRELGGADIDTRLHQQDFLADPVDPLLPWLGMAIPELEQQRVLMVVGCDIRQEQPLLAHRLRKAALTGSRVWFVNPLALDLTFESEQLVSGPWGMIDDLAAIASALGVAGQGAAADAIALAKVADDHRECASALQQIGSEAPGALLIGGLAASHPDYSAIKELCGLIAAANGAKLGYIPLAANSAGAHLAGALPYVEPGAKPADRIGCNARSMLVEHKSCLLGWGFEPDRDLCNPALAAESLTANNFVVACTVYRSAAWEAVADVMLPIAAFAETSGTFVNADLTWQSFRGAVPPPGEARPGWKVLRVLANLLDLQGFEYGASSDVLTELREACVDVHPDNALRGQVEPRSARPNGLSRIGTVPIYASDPLVRHAKSLQATPEAGSFGAYIAPDFAAKLGLAQGDRVRVQQADGAASEVLVGLDDRIPADCVRIPAGVPGSGSMGERIGVVQLVKV